VERIDVAGLTIAFERAGQGTPVVLLHGGLSDSSEWRRQIDALRDDFTVVAWDAPGCGRSSDPPEAFRLPDYADCLACTWIPRRCLRRSRAQRSHMHEAIGTNLKQRRWLKVTMDEGDHDLRSFCVVGRALRGRPELGLNRLEIVAPRPRFRPYSAVSWSLREKGV
jgi:alpha/beta hydrolase fold